MGETAFGSCFFHSYNLRALPQVICDLQSDFGSLG
jgi:hypothetical protein